MLFRSDGVGIFVERDPELAFGVRPVAFAHEVVGEDLVREGVVGIDREHAFDDAARAFFGGEPGIDAALQPLAEVGLDYLKLGQPVPTLSGGEAQRLKLAGFLSTASRPPRTRPRTDGKRGKLFLFDEPTTGLHFDDVARLLGAFRKLVAAGHTLVVIEHNLDVIRAADWIVDLGPEGGDAGGHVVVAGSAADVMACAASHTGAALRSYEAAPGVALARKIEEIGRAHV